VASAVQSFSGFGFGLLAVPFFAAALGAHDAVVLGNTLGTALSIAMLMREREALVWGSGLRMLAGSVAGLPLGIAILTVTDGRVLQATIAVLTIAFALVIAAGRRIPVSGRVPELAAGVASGAMRTSLALPGPPIVLFLQGRGTQAAAFRATLAAFFATSGIVSVSLLAATGQFSGASVSGSLVGLPAIAAGLLVGRLFHGRVDEARFSLVVLGVLIVGAVAALVGVFL
jgi:uncharacterized membrane protein YfcA